jgi:hypothetical protein
MWAVTMLTLIVGVAGYIISRRREEKSPGLIQELVEEYKNFATKQKQVEEQVRVLFRPAITDDEWLLLNYLSLGAEDRLWYGPMIELVFSMSLWDTAKSLIGKPTFRELEVEQMKLVADYAQARKAAVEAKRKRLAEEAEALRLQQAIENNDPRVEYTTVELWNMGKRVAMHTSAKLNEGIQIARIKLHATLLPDDEEKS